MWKGREEVVRAEEEGEGKGMDGWEIMAVVSNFVIFCYFHVFPEVCGHVSYAVCC